MCKKLKIAIPFYILFILNYSVLSQSTLNNTGQAYNFKRVDDIVYCKGGDQNLRLDIAWPVGFTRPTPAIVFIHGGFWLNGDKTEFSKTIEDVAKHGYVAITIDYRLGSLLGPFKNLFPASLEDSKCSVRWLRANAKKYNIDVDRIGAVGFSAGGSLALMMGNTVNAYEGNGGYQKFDSSIKGVVNISGPTDLRKLVKKMGTSPDFVTAQIIYYTLLRYTGYTIAADKKAGVEGPFRKASPTMYIDSTKFIPPVLSLYGEKDKIIGPSSGEFLDEPMKDEGFEHNMKVYEEGEHAFLFEDRWKDEVFNEIIQFFNDKFKEEVTDEVSLALPARDILRAARRIVYQTGPYYKISGILSCRQVTHEFPPYRTRNSCFVNVNHRRVKVYNAKKIIEILKEIRPMTGPFYRFRGPFRASSIRSEFPPYKVTENVELIK